MSGSPRNSVARRWLRLAWLPVAAIATIGAAVTWVQRDRPVYTDADTIRRPVSTEPPRSILWRTPETLDGSFAGLGEIYEPRLSWDGLTLYFVRGRAGGAADIWTAERTHKGWSEPRPLPSVSSRFDDLGPEPSRDGQSLYFYSDRDGGRGGYDLWVAQRGVDDWQTPINLGPAVNSEFNDYGPAVSADGGQLYFSSNRPRPGEDGESMKDAWPATIREDRHSRSYDLYQLPITQAGPQAATLLDIVNTPFNEGSPALSPSGDFVYFASDRPGGQGGFDLYRARLGRDRTPARIENLGPIVNSAANELDPAPAHLGFELFFSSDRAALAQSQPSVPSYRLFVTASREVYADADAAEPIDWRGLMAAIGPHMLWLLAGLLALLLLVIFARDMRDRRLSLLMRCLLASVMLHAVGLFLTSLWQVSAGIADFVGKRGGSRVRLTSSGGGGDAIVAQLRGGFSGSTVAVAAELTVSRAASESIQSSPVVAAILPVMHRAEVSEMPSGSSLAAKDADPAVARARTESPDEVVSHSIDRELGISGPKPEPGVSQAEQRESMPEAAGPVIAAADRRAVSVAAQDVSRVEISGDAINRAAIADEPTVRDTSLRHAVLRDRIPTSRPALELTDVATPVTSRPAALAIAGPTLAPAEATAADAEVGGTGTQQPVPSNPLASHRAANGLAQAPSALLPTNLSVSPPRGTTVFDGSTEKVIANSAIRDAAPARARSTDDGAGDVAGTGNAAVGLPKSSNQWALGLPVDSPQSIASDGEAAPSSGLPASELAPSRPVLPPARAGSAGESGTGSDEGGARVDLPAGRASTNLMLAGEERTTSIRAGDASVGPAHGGIRAAERFGSGAAGLATDRTALPLALPEIAAVDGEPADRVGAANGEESAVSEPAETLGYLTGIVRNIESGEPLAGVSIRLDTAGENPITAISDETGVFLLPVPRVPDYFAIAATRAGFNPGALNIPGAQVRGRSFRQDILLSPVDASELPLEREPLVHHLGNDAFEGAINSQFQREAEGRAFQAAFVLSAEQLPPRAASASLLLLAKGVQCPHPVLLNGKRITDRFARSPVDGSFGEQVFVLPVEWLIEGENTIEIRTSNCSGDLDDFEFINLRVRLNPQEEAEPPATPQDRSL